MSAARIAANLRSTRCVAKAALPEPPAPNKSSALGHSTLETTAWHSFPRFHPASAAANRSRGICRDLAATRPAGMSGAGRRHKAADKSVWRAAKDRPSIWIVATQHGAIRHREPAGIVGIVGEIKTSQWPSFIRASAGAQSCIAQHDLPSAVFRERYQTASGSVPSCAAAIPTAKAMQTPIKRLMFQDPERLPVEPDVFHAPAAAYGVPPLRNRKFPRLSAGGRWIRTIGSRPR